MAPFSSTVKSLLAIINKKKCGEKKKTLKAEGLNPNKEESCCWLRDGLKIYLQNINRHPLLVDVEHF